MIAVVRTAKGLCIVWETKKASLVSVTTQTYCGITQSAGDGVLQVPDDAKCCDACEKRVDELKIPRRPKPKS